MKELRRKVVNLAAELAQEEVERTGRDYIECVDKALDEACIRLGVNRKQFMRKPATINKDFEDAIKDMENRNKKAKEIDNSDLEMDCLECTLSEENKCADCCRDWNNEED